MKQACFENYDLLSCEHLVWFGFKHQSVLFVSCPRPDIFYFHACPVPILCNWYSLISTHATYSL